MDPRGERLRRLLAAFADQVEPSDGLPAIRSRIQRKTAALDWTSRAAAKADYLRGQPAMSHDLTFERTTLGHQMTAAMVLAHLIERGPREEVEWKLDRLGHLHGHVHRPNSDEQARRALDQFANFLGTVVARSQGHGKGSEWIHLAATGTYRGVPVNVWTHVAIRVTNPYGSKA